MNKMFSPAAFAAGQFCAWTAVRIVVRTIGKNQNDVGRGLTSENFRPSGKVDFAAAIAFLPFFRQPFSSPAAFAVSRRQRARPAYHGEFSEKMSVKY